MKTTRPTPLTDKFLTDLRERMTSLKIRKTELSSLLGCSKQHLQRYFTNPRSRAPSSEFVLKIQELIRKNFMKMFL